MSDSLDMGSIIRGAHIRNMRETIEQGSREQIIDLYMDLYGAYLSSQDLCKELMIEKLGFQDLAKPEL